MSDRIHSELNSFFETMGLLFVSSDFDEVQQEAKKALTDLGLDGEQIYLRDFKIYDKYVQEFQKHRVLSSEDALFFGENDSNYMMILIELIISNEDFISSPYDLNDQLINTQIIQICGTIFDKETNLEKADTIEEVINFLDSIELGDNAKWKLLTIMKQPKIHLMRIRDIINQNIGAYQKSVNEISKPLKKLLEQYDKTVKNHDDKIFSELKNKFSLDAEIYPTMVLPITQMISEKRCFYGLLSDLVTKNEKNRMQSKESLLLKLKALSDASKLEIISSLKASPKYNLEIARQLGLTAATMSHHMNVLLICGFVGVEKKDGKVYYHLETENIKDMIDELRSTLL